MSDVDGGSREEGIWQHDNRSEMRGHQGPSGRSSYTAQPVNTWLGSPHAIPGGYRTQDIMIDLFEYFDVAVRHGTCLRTA